MHSYGVLKPEILFYLRSAIAVGRKQIIKEFMDRGYNYNTIRRNLTELVKEGYLSKPFHGAYARTAKEAMPIKPFFRKYVSGLFYCSNKKKQFYALTFEANEISRMNDLIVSLEIEKGEECSDMRKNYGYSSMRYLQPVKASQIWPNIEIGEL